MSIREIKFIKKIEVFFRLLQSNENLIDALSKAGIRLPNRVVSLIKYR
ncbi:hypothetical protein [Halarcobacter bivalviorum]|nr:hypothetical protein [Halarcobacter bivalviorum]